MPHSYLLNWKVDFPATVFHGLKYIHFLKQGILKVYFFGWTNYSKKTHIVNLIPSTKFLHNQYVSITYHSLRQFFQLCRR